jgi:hypothetical protein
LHFWESEDGNSDRHSAGVEKCARNVERTCTSCQSMSICWLRQWTYVVSRRIDIERISGRWNFWHKLEGSRQGHHCENIVVAGRPLTGSWSHAEQSSSSALVAALLRLTKTFLIINSRSWKVTDWPQQTTQCDVHCTVEDRNGTGTQSYHPGIIPLDRNSNQMNCWLNCQGNYRGRNERQRIGNLKFRSPSRKWIEDSFSWSGNGLHIRIDWRCHTVETIEEISWVIPSQKLKIWG